MKQCDRIDSQANKSDKIKETLLTMDRKIDNVLHKSRNYVRPTIGLLGADNGKLIISTGDLSDVDGFYALAKYAQSGADVLFIMNYPAYLGASMEGKAEAADYEGFNFTTKQYFDGFEGSAVKTSFPEKTKVYDSLLREYKKYCNRDLSLAFKRVFTDLGFLLSMKVWKETQDSMSRDSVKGKLFYCIGGVNAISPFSLGMLKNEIFVYGSYVVGERIDLASYDETKIFDENKIEQKSNALFQKYEEIFIDFNGSMAFYHGIMREQINAYTGKIKGVFVMGGVYSNTPAKTMPRIPRVLNRFSCATMNQLYSPVKTASFFSDMSSNNIPIFMVANNEVDDLLDEPGWKSFLSVNGIQSGFLEGLASVYYGLTYSPPKKAFDFYTARALVSFMESSSLPSRVAFRNGDLHFDARYGVCLVSSRGAQWETAISEYISNCDSNPSPDDDARTKSKKSNFAEEHLKFQSLPHTSCVPVYIVHFFLDQGTKRLSILS